ncbi:nucleoside-diphosphate sugar epimerase/dehydratase [Variovorax sp. PCZ-1]|uniref:polysaccharide biosynthesis protein n=1 Tax=Variovorax sp. PCZ-1 TaxID=2835533 RepID=UPI001BD140CB|nr:nucleoside-diphosphate sugar epimerase/dehydratase [Variovorax sp. PCZ-1]MBS7808578.1 polysaccharide biosynthesis protein [Variovorax sp. PCZ-1]
MQLSNTRRISSLLALPRNAKKTIAVLADSSLCVLTVWLAICFRFESWVSLSGYQWLAVVASIVLAIPLLTAFGFYHTVIRYVGRQTITAALRAIAVYAVIYSAIFTVYGFPLVPRTIGVLQPLLLLIGLALLRLMANQLLTEQSVSVNRSEHLPNVLIYGAGNSGQQLAASLLANGERQVIGFLDDNVNLHKARISGIPVYGPNEFLKLSEKYQIHDVILAIPSLSRSRRTQIIKHFRQERVAIRTVPSLTDLAQGKVQESDLREIAIEDLLGRDPVAPMTDLMENTIRGKVVVVTGAGGSIGSELCRQIVKFSPKQLLLLELNELALYNITQELSEAKAFRKLTITPVLGNILDRAFLQALFAQHKPATIFHAAAYKHVPLVEANSAAGLRNNVLGTVTLAETAQQAAVCDMVMISTDKAVRPTNVMGASKRLAEIALHAIAQIPSDSPQKTRFCIVRFGNVLGSSGSVVPLFRQQIKQGGPITLTHPDITRYFMTIPEAAQLVLQAAGLNAEHALSRHVYLLDMGESVRIMDLAIAMVQLSGLSIKDDQHPEGDIAVEITGLRPGEKLYEELLVSDNAKPTRHPQILSAEDSVEIAFESSLRSIIDFCENPRSADNITAKLADFNIGYTHTP